MHVGDVGMVRVAVTGSATTAADEHLRVAIADAILAAKTIQGIARQPEAKNVLLVNMVIMVGLIESIPIIAAVIAIVLVMANPFLK